MELNEQLKQRAENKLRIAISNYTAEVRNGQFFKKIEGIKLENGKTIGDLFWHGGEAEKLIFNKLIDAWTENEISDFIKKVDEFDSQINDLKNFQE
jgi:hypothetical protein